MKSSTRKRGERSPLLRPEWGYVEKFDMDDFRRTGVSEVVYIGETRNLRRG